MLSDRHSALRVLLAGAFCVLISYLLLDRPIAAFAATLHKPVWCRWLTYLADVPVPASLIGLAGAGVAWLAGWRPGAVGRLAVAACVATLAADAAKDGLKLAFGRPWPETWVDNNPSWIGTHTYGFFPFHGGRGFASFPSGHTTVISAPCAVVGRWWLAALPALVAVGLLGCDYHFLSDCIAGALLGLAVGRTVKGSS